MAEEILVHKKPPTGKTADMTTAFRSSIRLPLTALLVASALFGLAGHSSAAAPHALPDGQAPKDVRLNPLKDLDGYFPFNPPASPGEWSVRAERVRRQILVSQGLWPMPTKTPLRAVIHGKVERPGYTVEKVYFESVPGFFVTGSLYRPTGRTGKLPGVLFAHGHWTNARLSESGDAELLNEIANGEERFEQGGKSRFQSMCVQLARMGCVVWQWDMLSDSDSQQLSREVIHTFAKQRAAMNNPENWGLYSPQAEAQLQSVMGLQTLNAVRSLDFLLSLPEVDSERIAITGASGGGTQTMLLAAIDPRVALSFPAVMVSTAMQGGCTCENSSLLRIGTGNVEFAGLFAPKPQGMTCANDWTREMSTKGFPELKKLYAMLGAPDNVMLKRGEHFPHNYNAVSRSAFFTWLNRHFKLGLKEPVIEADYQRLTPAELSVWDDAHPRPPGGDDFERALLRWLANDAAEQVQEWRKSPDLYRQRVGGALDIVIGRNLSEVGTVEWEMKKKEDRGGHLEMTGLLRETTHGEEVPAVFLYPKEWKGRTVIWIDEAGKAGLFQEDGSPRPEIKRLIDAGATVAGLDLLYQGEFLTDGQPVARTRGVKNPREAAAYSFGYNHTLFAQRTHDILTAIKYVRSSERKTESLEQVGLGKAGPWVAAARAQARDAIDRAAVDTGGFRFGRVPDIHSVDFLPGGAKYDDLPGMLIAGGTKPLWLAGEPEESAGIIRSAFQRAGAQNLLKTVKSGDAGQKEAVVAWLLEK
jgi:dienelactone hydrolase